MSKYINIFAPVGSTLAGAALKAQIDAGVINPVCVALSAPCEPPPETPEDLLALIGDDDFFAVLCNPKTGLVYFAKLLPIGKGFMIDTDQEA